MDDPNEYVLAIETYAAAYRNATRLHEIASHAEAAACVAEQKKQEAWRVVARYRNEGHVKPGIYLLKDLSTALHINNTGDYPDVLLLRP